MLSAWQGEEKREVLSARLPLLPWAAPPTIESTPEASLYKDEKKKKGYMVLREAASTFFG
jgi:hypothetical protein